MIRLFLLIPFLFGICIQIQAQCPLPIQILEHATECNNDGSLYSISFFLNRNDVQIESTESYEMFEKIDGSFAFFGIPANKFLTVSIEADDGCARVHSFDIPECAVYNPSFSPLPIETIHNPYKVLLPSAFSPNGDGLNDVWKYAGNNIQSLQIKVFNRWGNLIFEGDNIGIEWDGFYRGELVPSGIYPFIANVIFEDGTPVERRGNIMVLR